jgi:hypothetical protein
MSKIEVDTVEPQSGTSLTLGASGDTITIPSGATFDASASTTTLPDDSVTTAKLVDANVTLAKLSATGTKDATTFLRGDNTFQTIGTNTPNFQAYLSSAQTVTSGVEAKVQFDSEDFDSDNIYDNTTDYRFTVPSGEGGKYFVYSIILPFNSNNNSLYNNLYVYKNGSAIISLDYNVTGSPILRRTHLTYTSLLNLSVNDYIEIFGILDGTGTLNIGANSLFGAYKIIE